MNIAETFWSIIGGYIEWCGSPETAVLVALVIGFLLRGAK